MRPANNDDGTDSADADGKSNPPRAASVFDVLAFPIAYSTHRDASGRILPMGKHGSTSLGPGSQRRTLRTRLMRHATPLSTRLPVDRFGLDQFARGQLP